MTGFCTTQILMDTIPQLDKLDCMQHNITGHDTTRLDMTPDLLKTHMLCVYALTNLPSSQV